jgi:aminopeptidase
LTVLRSYADLTVKVGLNLQPGQRLLVIGPLANGGVSLEAAPLVREIAASAYAAGAPLVEALWGDESMLLARFASARPETLTEYPTWLPKALVEHVEGGHAMLSIYANDPDLLKQQPPEQVGAMQQAVSFAVRPFRELISRNQTNWAVVAAPAAGWASKMFPGVPADQQIPRLWDQIVKLCRLDRPDPIAAWNQHLKNLEESAAYLNGKQYQALKYSGPGTDLTLGLPAGHKWVSGRTVSRNGIPFTANLPTEEVFTMAHRELADGTVQSSKPLSYAGTLIEGFSLRFEKGRVVEVNAKRGESVLRQLIGTDEGAGRLGEIALVPHSSPISESGLLFYNTLFDENAASHVALGSAYKFTLRDGDTMNDEAFGKAGGNRSVVHVDFMIGSGELDVDGIAPDGTREPLMRRGEWAIQLR